MISPRRGERNRLALLRFRPLCRQLELTMRPGVRRVTMETETSVPAGGKCFENTAGNQRMCGSPGRRSGTCRQSTQTEGNQTCELRWFPLISENKRFVSGQVFFNPHACPGPGPEQKTRVLKRVCGPEEPHVSRFSNRLT